MPHFRPRLKFSLRTLFVLVAVVGCWLGYYLNWARQRRDYAGSAGNDTVHSTIPADSADVPRFPLGLRIVREQPYTTLNVIGEDLAEVERVSRLFPEADIIIGWPSTIDSDLPDDPDHGKQQRSAATSPKNEQRQNQ